MWPWTTKPVLNVNLWKLIYASKIWINKFSTDVWFVMICLYLAENIWLKKKKKKKKKKKEKFAFKMIQIKGESHFSVLPLPLRLTPSPCPSKPSGKR